MKRIPKHETTSSYFQLVVCTIERMMRCGEENHNVHDLHDGYEEEMAPSSDINDTDEEESKIPSCTNLFTIIHRYIYVWT